MSAPGRRFRGADQAGVVGGDDELGAVARTQLHEQSADVGLGGGQADLQLGHDLGVGQAEPDQGQEFALPVGYLIQRGRGTLPGFGAPGELRDEPPGDAGGEQRVACPVPASPVPAGRAPLSGNWAVTRTPHPGSGSARTPPPYMPTRSRIPAIPAPAAAAARQEVGTQKRSLTPRWASNRPPLDVITFREARVTSSQVIRTGSMPSPAATGSARASMAVACPRRRAERLMS